MFENVVVGVILSGAALLLCGGLFTYLCGCLKPGFFFRHPKVLEMVKARGVAGAGKFYCDLGLYCLGFACVCLISWLLVAMTPVFWILLALLASGMMFEALRRFGQRRNLTSTLSR